MTDGAATFVLSVGFSDVESELLFIIVYITINERKRNYVGINSINFL